MSSLIFLFSIESLVSEFQKSSFFCRREDATEFSVTIISHFPWKKTVKDRGVVSGSELRVCNQNDMGSSSFTQVIYGLQVLIFSSIK